MTITSLALSSIADSILAARRRVLGGTLTESRLLKTVRQELERRSNHQFEELVALSRKAAQRSLSSLRNATERLVAAGKKLRDFVRAATTKFTHPAWQRLESYHWGRIIETARSEKLKGNVKGAIREILLMGHELLDNLVERMGRKVAKFNATHGTKWVEKVVTVRGGLQRKGEANIQEIGDIFLVAVAGDPPPVIKGDTKRVWILSIVESKSPTNRWDAYGQLREDVSRIQRDGITLNGEYYTPDEIHIDLPKASQDPEDWTTELVAALPKSPTSPAKFGEVTKGTVVNPWVLDVPESEIERAADLALDAAAKLGDDLTQ